ncbi:MAG: guanylate kinase [Candidatus Tectomicrobia bacterium]|uniref:Guanylate kinase n=1 Tax=Tectimicrobiota bacterium TaxID=2528274 RepID=A0A937W4B9_UNCTE|nr:guanylate kinase [Candidatus Tectomicrobia bacterium]
MPSTVRQDLAARRGIVFVLSAPSGAGKTSISARLIATMADVVQVITCTTRAPRAGEVNGREYHFLSLQAFEQHVAAGDFLEWAQVHEARYGTLRQSVETAVAMGHDVLLVIDVQGAATLRAAGIDAVYVFVLPPSWEVLIERLQQRGSESAPVQAQRLQVARHEVAHYTAYQYVIINDRLDDAVETLRAIILAERHRITRLGTVPIAPLLASE